VKPNIVLETPLPKEVSLQLLNTAAIKTFELSKLEVIGNIHLAIVNKAQSKRLNAQFAGNNYATDVLSFAYETANSLNELKVPQAKAEIVICLPIARKQAKEYSIDVSSEVVLLFVHGLLHVLGCDHQNNNDKASFESLQNDIIKSLDLNTRKMKWLH
jgi:probable rRNA maturation factor